jgi:hypothetical protein
MVALLPVALLALSGMPVVGQFESLIPPEPADMAGRPGWLEWHLEELLAFVGELAGAG